MRRFFFSLIFISMFGAAGTNAETLPLTQNLIALDSDPGEELLLGAEARNDYFPLSIHFTTQVHPAYCGPATIAMVLNALDMPRPPSDMTIGLGMFDQENIFTPATRKVKLSSTIKKEGMTLNELGAVLSAHELDVNVIHAGDSSAEEFRKIASQVLDDDEKFVLVNYRRKEIGQEKGGHISPLGAYDEDTDRFLILDVSRYKYPPVWVEAETLFSAMNTIDTDNFSKTRGYIIVGR
ncbi:MAG: phytochelatin synthase family protein [Rhizobiaceae bacterium]